MGIAYLVDYYLPSFIFLFYFTYFQIFYGLAWLSLLGVLFS